MIYFIKVLRIKSAQNENKFWSFVRRILRRVIKVDRIQMNSGRKRKFQHLILETSQPHNKLRNQSYV